MIQVTLTFHSIAAAVAALSALGPTLQADTAINAASGSGGTGNVQPSAAAPQASKSAGTKKDTPAAGPAAAASPASSPKPAAEAGTTDAPLDYVKDVRPLVVKAGTVPGGREKLIALFGEFGVAKGTELKPEQLAGFHPKVKAICGGQEA